MKNFLNWLLLASLTITAAAQNEKISQLPAGSPAVSTDLFPIARSGANYSLPISAITYTLPAATSSTLGGVKPDGTTIANSSGAISVNFAALSDLNSVFYATQYSGADPSIQLNACLAAAIAVGGTCDARGLVSPANSTYPHSPQYQITSEQITVGDANNDPVTLLLPNFFYWAGGMTDGTSCTLKQYPNSQIIGPGNMNSDTAIIGAGPSSNLGYMYCAAGVSGNSYLYAFGFTVQQHSGGLFVGHATANGVGAFIGTPFFDETTWDHVSWFDDLDTYVLEIQGVCCNASLNFNSINGNYAAIPLYILNTGSPTGLTQSFNIMNSSIVHNPSGSPLVLYTDSYNNESSVNFTNIYSENYASTTNGLFELNGPGQVAITNWNVKAEASSTTTPLITTSNAANTMLNLVNIHANNASGTFTYPITAVSNGYTGGTIKMLNGTVSGTAHLGFYDSTNPSYVSTTGSADAYVLASSVPYLISGMPFSFLPNFANTTTTPTLNVNGIGAKTITKLGHAAVAANDLTTTAIATAIYDGTDFQLQDPQTAVGSTAVSPIVITSGAISLQNSTPANVTTAYGTDMAYPTASGGAFTNGDVLEGDANGGMKDSGTLLSGLAGGASGCTSGCNYVLTTMDNPQVFPGNGHVLGTANQGSYVQFYNTLQRKLGNACVALATASTSGHFDVGVYSVSGTTGTLQWHTGSQSTTTAGTAICATPSAYTLAASTTYYIAWCADNTTATLSSMTTGGNPSVVATSGTAHTAGLDATDTCTTGVLPSSITTTNISNSNSASVPYVYVSN